MFNFKQRFSLLGDKFFTQVQPQPLDNYCLVHINRELQQAINLQNFGDDLLVKVIAADQVFEAYQPIASVYAGHQFGVAVPQLGDGRAMLIAEHADSNNQIWEIQLKGAGLTPYSRMGDGRAVLRSTIREYIASYALDKLRIPTTLALGMVSSDTPVYREQVESGAIVMRVAPSFIRFGHFEYFAKRRMSVELKELVDFVISNYFLQIQINADGYIGEFLQQVVILTAHLIAKWQSIGFVHGVMNTDNMSILGLTIDYGPYAFMDKFMPNHAYNHSDNEGRYTYAQQVYIAWWNLYRLAEALALIYPDSEQLGQILASYSDHYNRKYIELVGYKLGFKQFGEADLTLGERFFKILQQYQMDWTYSWRQLSYGEVGKQKLVAHYNLGDDFASWYFEWQQALAKADINIGEANRLMQLHNPALVPRSYLLQDVIAKADAGNYTELERLMLALSTPYIENDEYADYYKLPPSWAEHINLSCSS